jgi:hypothetical protein
MTTERYCDCSGHHEEFVPYEPSFLASDRGLMMALSRRPAMHLHEDDRCAIIMPGCPGLPWCRSWIIGGYHLAEKMAAAHGAIDRAFEIRLHREDIEREFSRIPAVGIYPGTRVRVTSGDDAGRIGVILAPSVDIQLEENGDILQLMTLLREQADAIFGKPGNVIVQLDADNGQAAADGGQGGRSGKLVTIAPHFIEAAP